MIIAPEYLSQLKKHPEALVRVIIRTQAIRPEYQSHIQALGLTLTHTYTLLPAMAAQGPAKAVLALLNEPWITQIEPDHPVQAHSS